MTSRLAGFAAGQGRSLIQLFDLVAVDPRGSRRSGPATCAKSATPALPFTLLPTSASQLRKQIRILDPRLRRPCEDGKGLPHLGTVANARDLEAVRVALGEDRITYFGSSYGSVLGLVYARLYPERVRVLAFDGALNPDVAGGVPTGRAVTLRIPGPVQGWHGRGPGPGSVNVVWAVDFQCDADEYGRQIKICSIVEEHTGERLDGLTTHLEDLVAVLGAPAALRSDNSPGCISDAMADWARTPTGLS